MNQAELIRALQKMTPKTPYGALLKTEFNVELPDTAPKYQMEYLYKYCLSMRVDGVPDAEIVTKAATKVNEFISKFPWVTMKYDDVVTASAPKAKKESAEHPDGTIVFSESRGIYLLWVAGKILSRGKTVEKVKALATKKHNFTAFAK